MILFVAHTSVSLAFEWRERGPGSEWNIPLPPHPNSRPDAILQFVLFAHATRMAVCLHALADVDGVSASDVASAVALVWPGAAVGVAPNRLAGEMQLKMQKSLPLLFSFPLYTAFPRRPLNGQRNWKIYNYIIFP